MQEKESVRIENSVTRYNCSDAEQLPTRRNYQSAPHNH